ncbi:MAG: hypothetical protein INR71_02640 [Terriglobus roseus]|nr:hypothetical protein [Terriglobus roseus]
MQRNGSRKGAVASPGATPISPTNTPSTSTTANLAAALSLPYLNFTSPHSLKPVKLTLTPHHLFYLLSRFEEIGISVGPMNVRLENIHSNTSPAEYVSFLSQAQRKKVRNSDRESIHSVSSLRSVMSGMTSFWSGFSLSSRSAAKTEKQMAALKEDMKYLYSSFTKIPCLRLAPDHKSRLIAGYEEFPFDTAVPLFAFKNLSALEISDVDFRQFYGWDRMADQLRSLTLKRASLDDPTDLLVNIVLDDMDKRRRKAAKAPGSPTTPLATTSPRMKHAELALYSPEADSPAAVRRLSSEASDRPGDYLDGSPAAKAKFNRRPRSASPSRLTSPPQSAHHSRTSITQLRRSSGSSGSSVKSNTPRGSTANLLSFGVLPPAKWRFLRHLSIADNSLTTLSVSSLAPVANSLQSLDLSSNLFTEIPDSLASLTALRALNLSNCMISSLHSLRKGPLPAVTTLNLRHNRLASLAGIERLLSLERVDFRDNRLSDPVELARLTCIPDIREVFVHHNPFTKTHHGFRISIFNLFRATPGYHEDILIDSNPPTYSERKHLVDRAPEPASVPVIAPSSEDEVERPSVSSSGVPDAVAQPRPSPLDENPTVSARPSPVHPVESHKRRRGPRRRVVELVEEQTPDIQTSFNETQPAGLVASPTASSEGVTPTDDVQLGPTTSNDSSASQPNPTPLKPYTLPLTTLDTNIPPEDGRVPTRSISEIPVSGGDTYKKRIEALRIDLGPAWLSALTDESWDSTGRAGAIPHTTQMSPSMPVRTQSQSMVTTGRTLG